MRRSRWVDWLLLGTLLPVFVAMLAGSIQATRAAGSRHLPLALSGVQGADGYPIVRWLHGSHAEIQRGDRILRIGALDLRGLGIFEIEHRMRARLAQGRPIAVEAERHGVRFETEIEPLPHPSWWWPLPSWCAFVLVATFLLVRAPHWPLRRVFFVLMLAWACFGVGGLQGVHPLQKNAALVLALPLAFGGTLWFYLAWAEKGRPAGFGQALAWALGLAWLGVQALNFVLGLPTGGLPDALTGVLAIGMPPLLVGALFRTYRRSDGLERRQLRWILYTTLVSSIPIALVFFAAAFVPQLDDRFFDVGWSLLGLCSVVFGVGIVCL
jgi:hypothetical protein